MLIFLQSLCKIFALHSAPASHEGKYNMPLTEDDELVIKAAAPKILFHFQQTSQQTVNYLPKTRFDLNKNPIHAISCIETDKESLFESYIKSEFPFDHAEILNAYKTVTHEPPVQALKNFFFSILNSSTEKGTLKTTLKREYEELFVTTSKYILNAFSKELEKNLLAKQKHLFSEADNQVHMDSDDEMYFSPTASMTPLNDSRSNPQSISVSPRQFITEHSSTSKLVFFPEPEAAQTVNTCLPEGFCSIS